MTAATDRMAVLWYLGSDGSIQRNELAVPGSESVSCVHWSEEGNLLAMGKGSSINNVKILQGHSNVIFELSRITDKMKHFKIRFLEVIDFSLDLIGIF